MTDDDAFLAAIDAGDQMARLVLADELDDRGWPIAAASLRGGGWMVRKKIGGYGDGGGGYGGYGGYGGGGRGGYGDGGGYGRYGGGDGDGGGYGDGGDGEGDGGGDGDVIIISRGYSMLDGLKIICSPAGWAPYVVVAWCRVHDGWIEYAPGARVLRRFGGLAQLANLAAKGPIATTELLDPSQLGGGCSMGCVSRFEVCDPKAWSKHCPKPEGWE